MLYIYIYINSYDHVTPDTEDFDHVECERFEVQARTSQYREWMYMKRKDSRKFETHEI